jgi:hypothetical protein
VSWTSGNAHHYEIVRSSAGAAAAIIGTSSTTSYVDSAVVPNKTYVYRVRALAADNTASLYSAPDVATTIIFVDEPLVARVTVIKAVHLFELRRAVDAVRAAAGMGGAAVTDALPVFVKAIHIQELRAALDVARAAIGASPLSYANPVSGPVRAVDLMEVRRGTQ